MKTAGKLPLSKNFFCGAVYSFFAEIDALMVCFGPGADLRICTSSHVILFGKTINGSVVLANYRKQGCAVGRRLPVNILEVGYS